MVYRGVASSALHNKAMYQCSLMVNALAQFMVSQGYDANDTDAPSAFNGNLIELFSKFKPQMVDVSLRSGQHEADELLATFTYNPRLILSTCFGSSVGPEWVMGLLWPFRTQFIKKGGLSYFTFEKQGLNFVYKKVSNERLPLDWTVDMIIFY